MSLSAFEILRRAAPLFEERGYHGTSMSLLAEACDLAKPGLYHHFRDKEALFLALLEEGLAALEVELDRLEERIGRQPPGAGLTEIVAMLLAPPEAARLAMRLAEQDLTHLSEESRSRLAAAYRRRFPERIGSLLERAGLRPGMDPQLATTALLGMASAFHRRNPSNPAPASLVADLFARGALEA
jgi:AcrR family transcriptional regulator